MGDVHLKEAWLAGVDGCRSGWMVALVEPHGEEVRPLLGARKCSVFSVRARPAICADEFRLACRIASEISEPPRMVSKQLFSIAPRIREIDALLRGDAAVAARVFEVHPEVAFWRLDGEQALAEPKKVKSRPYGPGLALRRDLLVGAGIPAESIDAGPPAGDGPDDLLDAFACALAARRIHAGWPGRFRIRRSPTPMASRWRSGRDAEAELTNERRPPSLRAGEAGEAIRASAAPRDDGIQHCDHVHGRPK